MLESQVELEGVYVELPLGRVHQPSTCHLTSVTSGEMIISFLAYIMDEVLAYIMDEVPRQILNSNFRDV